MCISAHRSMIMSLVVFFFFFKQKTAYEMRISDWSSDVCSSDLIRQLAHDRNRADDLVDALALHAHGHHERADLRIRALAGHDFAHHVAHLVGTQEIGRASCRERVCQYV